MITIDNENGRVLIEMLRNANIDCTFRCNGVFTLYFFTGNWFLQSWDGRILHNSEDLDSVLKTAVELLEKTEGED